MGSAFLLMLREGVEGALVVAILLAYLRRIDRRRDFRWVWAGTLSAVGISLLAGVGAFMLLGGLEGRAEEIMEGTVALVAAGVLTWMIFWMAKQARLIRSRLEEKVDAALEAGSLFGLAGIAFVAVLREGIESALFLISTSVGSDSSAPRVLGGLAGVSAAIGICYLVYRGSQRVNLRVFFRTTGILIILFAAGLLAKGIHEFQEVALIGTINDHLWDVRDIGILDPRTSLIADLLQGLFGWSPSPSFEMVLAYFAYLIPVGASFLRLTAKLPSARYVQPAEASAR